METWTRIVGRGLGPGSHLEREAVGVAGGSSQLRSASPEAGGTRPWVLSFPPSHLPPAKLRPLSAPKKLHLCFSL